MKKANCTNSPCYFETRSSDPEYAAMPLEPFSVRGIDYLPATNAALGMIGIKTATQSVCVMLGVESPFGNFGLATTLTAASARQWAATLLQRADEMEARAASTTTDVLNRARKAPKP